MKNRNGGYIALTSIIIMLAIISMVVVTLSYFGFFSRSNALDAYFKDASLFLAEGCVDEAILRLAQDPAYAGMETLIDADGNQCTIVAVFDSGVNEKTIQAEASISGATTRIVAEIAADDLDILSWEEVLTF